MNVSRHTRDGLSQPVRAALSRHSLYASPDFAALWEAKGGQPVFWTFSKEDRIVAVLPGVEFGSRPLARFQSMPDGLPARIVFIDCDHSEQTEITSSLLKAIQRHGYAKVFITDFYHEYEIHTDFKELEQATALVDISAESWQPPDKTLVSEIRKAEREGVVVQSFETSRHLAPFISLLRATEQRLGVTPRYPDPFYAALGSLSETDSRVTWTIVEWESQAVASHIYLLDGDTALYWVACLDKEFSFLKANQFMLFSQARRFAEEGIVRLNLGQTPPEAESLAAFKEKWGGTPYAYPCYTSQSLLGRIR